MSTLISNNGGFRVFCKTTKVEAVADTFHVEVYSTYESAKDPLEQRNIARLTLDQAGLDAFKNALSVK